MDRVAELEAELAVAKLEQELIDAKPGDPDDASYRELKTQVREARRDFREMRGDE